MFDLLDLWSWTSGAVPAVRARICISDRLVNLCALEDRQPARLTIDSFVPDCEPEVCP